MSHEHEDIRANARKNGAWEISSDETATVIAGDARTQEENSYVMRPETVGIMATGKSTLPGLELGDGPVFGSWPGLVFLGPMRDDKGEIVNSQVAGNPGMMVLMEEPDMVIQTVYNMLSILLTEAQARMIIEIFESLVEENMENHTPPMLVERTMTSKGITIDDLDLPKQNEDKKRVGLADISTDSGIQGLIHVARNSDLPEEHVATLEEILQDESLTAREKYDKASDFLAEHGIILLNLSDTGVKNPGMLAELLKGMTPDQDVSGEKNGTAFSADMTAQELMQLIPEEKAVELMLKVLDTAEKGLEALDENDTEED
jgi:hypothetical protein